MKFLRENYFIFLILLIYAAIFLVFKPYQYNFPSNDDWVYAYSVEKLLKTNQLQLSDWCAATGVFHILFGWLWCRVSGLEPVGFASGSLFGCLRVSTLVLSFAGALFMYFIIKLFVKEKNLSVLGAVVLVSNPLYFNLSHTFMTDISYLSLFVISLFFFLYSVKNGVDSYLFLGSIFAALAYLVRQIGILIPVAVGLFLVKNKSLNLRRLVLVFIVPVLVFVGHWYWLNFVHKLPWIHQAGGAFKLSLKGSYSALTASMFYIGFFSLPFSLTFLFTRRTKPVSLNWTKQLVIFILIFALVINVLFRGFLPYLENVIHRYGLGTITVSGAKYKSAGSFITGNAFWIIMTVVSGISFVIFVKNVISQNFSKFFSLAFIVCLLQFFASLLRFDFFDRYILVVLPLMVMLGMEAIRIRNRKINYGFLLGILIFVFYAGLGTKDYLNWNQAKWSAGKLAMSMGYQPQEIANGFDWDGYFTFKKNMDKLKSMKPAKSIGIWEWQKLNPYRVLMSFSSENTGYELLGKVSYYDVFIRGKAYIYIWKL